MSSVGHLHAEVNVLKVEEYSEVYIESDVPACGPPASFSVHLASSAVTPAESVHKSRGDNVVRMWVQLKR